MKKIIVMLCLVTTLSKAQTKCDTLAAEYRASILSIQTNFVKSNQEFQVGCGLVCAGLWINMTALIGRNQDFVANKQYKQFMIAATVIEAIGVGVVFYSHTFINKAIQVSPTKIVYQFK